MIKNLESISPDESVVFSDTEQRFYEILRRIQNNRRTSKENKAMRIAERCATALVDPEYRLSWERIEIIRDKVTKGE